MTLRPVSKLALPLRPRPPAPPRPRSDLLDELQERVRLAVALPVRIDIRDAFDDLCTEVGRAGRSAGRPAAVGLGDSLLGLRCCCCCCWGGC